MLLPEKRFSLLIDKSRVGGGGEAGAEEVGGGEEGSGFFGVLLVLSDEAAVVGDTGIGGGDQGGLRQGFVR